MNNSSAYELGRILGSLGVVALVAVIGLGAFAWFVASVVKAIHSKTRRGLWITSAVFSAVLMLLMTIGIAGLFFKKMEAMDQAARLPKLHTSSDGLFTITVPSAWKPYDFDVPEASVKLANPFAEQYCLAFSESKTDVGLTLQEVDKITIEQIGRTEKISPSRAKPVTINGLNGIQRRFELYEAKVQATYLRTVIESPTHYHYLSFWSLASRADANFPVFESALKTFKVLPQKAEAATRPSGQSPAQIVTTIITEQLGIAPTRVIPTATLKSLGADDLDHVELIMALEDAFQFTIDDDTAAKFITVGDLIRHAEKNTR